MVDNSHTAIILDYKAIDESLYMTSLSYSELDLTIYLLKSKSQESETSSPYLAGLRSSCDV